MAMGKRLERQLKKFLGSTEAPDLFGKLSSSENIDCPQVKKALNGFSKLIVEVDKTYEQLEDKLNMAVRNLELSSGELSNANRNINSMLNSLGQGFLSFTEEGTCCPTYSRACEAMFGMIPAGKAVWDVLPLSDDDKQEFKNWIGLVYQDRLDFEEIETFAPKMCKTPGGQSLELGYKLIRHTDESLDRIVLIATDKTSEEEAKNLAHERSRYADRVVKLLTSKQHFSKFITYFREFVAEFQDVQELSMGGRREIFLRQVHTLKGSAGAFLMDEFQAMVHALEDRLLDSECDISAGEIRDETAAWEKHVDAFLVECEDIFEDGLEDSHNRKQVEKDELNTFFADLVSRGQTDLAVEFYNRFMTEPVGQFVSHLDSMVADLAKRLNKPMRPLVVVGGDLRIEPQPFERVFANLVHVVRNSIDHGIEEPDARLVRGKPVEGSLAISFSMKDDSFIIRIQDDGGGIDSSRIIAKYKKMGQEIDENAPYEEIIQKVFDDGFSTSEKATDISGRGVGMSSLLDEARQLGGDAWVESELGKYCRTTIRLPYLLKKSKKAELKETG